MEIEIRDAEPGDPEAISADCDTLLAYAGSEPVATAGLKPLEPDLGEIKRMHVVPSHRGAGTAGRMLEELERRARARGFRAVRLDTHDRLSEATKMYSGAGYGQIPDYNSNPRSNRWFERPLA